MSNDAAVKYVEKTFKRSKAVEEAIARVKGKLVDVDIPNLKDKLDLAAELGIKPTFEECVVEEKSSRLFLPSPARGEQTSALPPPSPALPSTPDPAPQTEKAKYEPLLFDTPQDLLQFIRPHISYHPWQVDTSNQLAGYFQVGLPKQRPTDKQPLLYNLVAANGSGKDSYVIAPFAVWFIVTKIKSRCIITSSSHDQLKNQTFKYISELCRDLNELMGEKLFDIVEFKITCLKTGAEIKMFVTDEAGKAEGYHPDPTYPDAEMAIIVNEAKSIPEELWTAFLRFTGYNYWIEISSPGSAFGHFYKASTSPNTIRHPEPPQLGRRFVRFITAYECPNISQAHIAEVIHEHGEDSMLVKSMIKAEFSDLDSTNLIKTEIYDECVKRPPAHIKTGIGIGLDLAAGGDEITCYVRHGNKIIDSWFFRQRNTTLSVAALDEFLSPYKSDSYVFNADNGGLGHPMIDSLQALGWRINRCNNQSPPADPKFFGNLGAQMYWHIKRLLERREIIPGDDAKTREQLTTRNTKGSESAQGKITLESKKEARAKGRPSPDRADAFVLCFFSYKRTANDSPLDTKPVGKIVNVGELARMLSRGLVSYEPPKQRASIPTSLSGPLFENVGKHNSYNI